jgi:hypothetical protein
MFPRTASEAEALTVHGVAADAGVGEQAVQQQPG